MALRIVLVVYCELILLSRRPANTAYLPLLSPIELNLRKTVSNLCSRFSSTTCPSHCHQIIESLHDESLQLRHELQVEWRISSNARARLQQLAAVHATADQRSICFPATISAAASGRAFELPAPDSTSSSAKYHAAARPPYATTTDDGSAA